MAQKSNPISLRLEKTNKHYNSCWYGDYNYTSQLLNDCAISAHMENICHQAKMAPPVVFINRGRQRVNTFFFFPRQQSIRKIRIKRGKIFKAPEQRRDWLSDLFLSYKKNSAYTPSQKENATTLSLDQEKARRQGMTEQKSLLQYFLLSLLSAKPNNTLIHLDDISSCQQNSSWNRWAGHALKKSSGRVALGESNNSALVELRKDAPGAKIRGNFAQESSQIWGTAEERRGKVEADLVKKRQGFVKRKTTLCIKDAKGTYPFKEASWTTPIKNHLEQSIFRQTHYRCKVHYLLCPSAHQNPLFLATQVVFALEERVPFRRLKHKLIRDISKDQTIKGVRITCSGRVAARSKKAQKARTESIQWGQTSLHVFSDFVHFASRSARTGFGKIGVKVWICYR